MMELRDVTVTFEGHAAVEHVSMKIERGEYTVLLGRNGSGKTTLMRAMLGLVRPRSGQILLGDGLRRDHIGYMPQKTQAQRDFPASVEEVVRSGLINRMGLRMRYSAEERRARWKPCACLALPICAKGPIPPSRADSSSASFWRGRCARPTAC